MRNECLDRAFGGIRPSAGFAEALEARLREKRRAAARGRRIRRPVLAAAACGVFLCASLFLLPKEEVSPPPAASDGAGSAAVLTGPVDYADLQLPPDDGLELEGEAGTYPTGDADILLGNAVTGLAGCTALVRGTVEQVRVNRYVFQPEGEVRWRDDAIVYEIRVEYVYGARGDLAELQAGDSLVLENLMYTLTSASLEGYAQRMQAGHTYVIPVRQEPTQIWAPGMSEMILDDSLRKESPYCVRNPILPPVERTLDNCYLFFGKWMRGEAVGWYDLIGEDTVHVIMPEEADPAFKENMYLRPGAAFDANLQRLADQYF